MAGEPGPALNRAAEPKTELIVERIYEPDEEWMRRLLDLLLRIDDPIDPDDER